MAFLIIAAQLTWVLLALIIQSEIRQRAIAGVLELYTHISVLIRRRYQAAQEMHLCCSYSSPTLPGYLQHHCHLRWRWENKGLVCIQDVRGQLQMGCDSRGLQIAGIISWVEITEVIRNREVCNTLMQPVSIAVNVCFQTSCPPLGTLCVL